MIQTIPQMPIPSILVSDDGTIQAASQEAEDLGYAAGGTIAPDCLDRIKQGIPIEIALGDRYWRLENTKTEGGIVVVAIDITCEIAQKNSLSRKLEKRTSQMGRFLRHDLKTPLATSVYWLEQALKKQDFSYIQRAINTINRTSEMVDRSGYLYGKGVMGKEEVRAVDMLNHCIDDLRGFADERNAQITVKGNGTILYGEIVRLRQVFSNLIVNAIKFVPKERSPVVEIAVSHDHQYTIITVADNGVGIPEEFQEKIFEPMERLHSRSGIEGEGLGLAIALDVVEEHGGKILVESTLNVGTKFTVLLPLENALPRTAS